MLDVLLHRYLRIPYALNVHKVRVVARPRATVLFLHGIGNSGAAWDPVIYKLPKDIDIISVDLLGFGRSPSPDWAKYDTSTQAKSVIATLLKLRVRQQLIIVGHSMGALVAVEIARRYPIIVKRLILCSPPFYNVEEARRIIPSQDKALRDFYRLLKRYPEEFTKLMPLVKKYKLAESSFHVDDENVDSYMAALEASIINQTSLEDAKRLGVPLTMIRGAFDPVVVKRNLDDIVEANPKAKLKTILTGHPLKGAYFSAVVDAITDAVSPESAHE